MCMLHDDHDYYYERKKLCFFLHSFPPPYTIAIAWTDAFTKFNYKTTATASPCM